MNYTNTHRDWERKWKGEGRYSVTFVFTDRTIVLETDLSVEISSLWTLAAIPSPVSTEMGYKIHRKNKG